MNDPKVSYRMIPNILSPSQGYTTNSVIITIKTISEEILENPTTGHRTLTGRSNLVQQPILINLRSSCHAHIYQLLRNQLVNHRRLCEDLALKISSAAILLCEYVFTLTIPVKITYQTVVVPSPLNNEALLLRDLLLKMVFLGRIGKEESKSLKIETEPCSICLDNLTGSSKHGVPTRMTCSHVFHDRCLLEWLNRKNTCSLCRTVLYDLDDLASQLLF